MANATKKILTIFGATGNQGTSIINVVLAHPDLASRYHLRGVTRNVSSPKSQSLASKGVEMVPADLFNKSTILSAVTGSYGVFANTDYWTLLDKDKEIAQGKNIYDACIEASVHHVVFSTLPKISALSNGKYQGVAHFESKAAVRDYIDSKRQLHKDKGPIVSYFLPAMYMENIRMATQESENKAMISLPFAEANVPWPMLAPARDTGKYVVGLFEAGEEADGVALQGVSEWTTPTKVAAVMGKKLGKKTRFNPIEGDTYRKYLPENVGEELMQMMLWIGEASYYGKGTEKKQGESEKWLVKGVTLTSWEKFVEEEF